MEPIVVVSISGFLPLRCSLWWTFSVAHCVLYRRGAREGKQKERIEEKTGGRNEYSARNIVSTRMREVEERERSF
jgi:hypothetical protein